MADESCELNIHVSKQ